MKKIGLYIHIPFCKSKCYYCDFNSYSRKECFIERYIEKAKKEIQQYNLEQYEIETIYIGGGTPSYIDEKYIKEILNNINISKAKEITIEVNPGTATYEKLQNYYNIGINRLSIGLQSTNNELLKDIGRIHNYEQFLETYNMAKTVGFKNINVDLMLALPNQTMQDLQDSLEKIVSLRPNHISVYSLILEEGTVLYKKYEESNLKLPTDEQEREMYWFTRNYLQKNNYEHYEISNFALKGYRALHNTNCWEQKEYIGIGAGASSFLNEKRYINSTLIEEYIKNNKQTIEEVLTSKTKMQEFVMLGLRKMEGVSLQEFKDKFQQEFIEVFKKEYETLYKEGLFFIENKGENDLERQQLKLTNKGIDLANLVWEEFV